MFDTFIFTINKLLHRVVISATEQRSGRNSHWHSCAVLHHTYNCVSPAATIEERNGFNSSQCIKMNPLNISVTFPSLEFRKGFIIGVYNDTSAVAQDLTWSVMV